MTPEEEPRARNNPAPAPIHRCKAFAHGEPTDVVALQADVLSLLAVLDTTTAERNEHAKRADDNLDQGIAEYKLRVAAEARCVALTAEIEAAHAELDEAGVSRSSFCGPFGDIKYEERELNLVGRIHWLAAAGSSANPEESEPAKHECPRCGSDEWSDVGYDGCSGCREPEESEAKPDRCSAESGGRRCWLSSGHVGYHKSGRWTWANIVRAGSSAEDTQP